MTMRERQRQVQLYRGQVTSPGRPTTAWREDRVRFWAAISWGASSEDAGCAAGVSPAVGTRWFRQAGGVDPNLPPAVSGRFLSFAERESIAVWHAQKAGVREIARRLGRAPSTISRELRRNASTRTWRLDYRASVAQWHAERRARRPKVSKLAADERLRDYVQDWLGGAVTRPDGESVPGPGVRWAGRRHGRRADRRWSRSWSPEQIASRLRADFPADETMRVSHEAIYQALYIRGRGGLARELTACPRTGRALRVPRARTRGRGKNFLSPQVMISARPAEASSRAVPGHWEGDLFMGRNSSAIGTLVERATRFTVLLHLPPMAGHGGPRARNSPALAGHGAEAVRDAITAAVSALPGRAAPLADLGPGRRDGPARPAPRRHRPGRLLRRPALALAARHQREHQRPAPPVLPQGHRPGPPHPRRPGRRRQRPQHPPPQDTRLEDTRRSARRVP